MVLRKYKDDGITVIVWISGGVCMGIVRLGRSSRSIASLSFCAAIRFSRNGSKSVRNPNRTTSSIHWKLFYVPQTSLLALASVQLLLPILTLHWLFLISISYLLFFFLLFCNYLSMLMFFPRSIDIYWPTCDFTECSAAQDGSLCWEC